MRSFAVLAGAAALGLGMQTASAYDALYSITFTFGGSALGASSDQGFVTSAGALAMTQPTNTSLISQFGGANSQSSYNSDFAVAGDCVAGGAYVPGTATPTGTRKYGCRYNTYGGTPQFIGIDLADAGPVASASGILSITDTTMTGTLTINATSDEPTGATTAIQGGTRVSNSVGNGFEGYNYRTADGSPFGSAWYGVTTAGQLAVNLTGTFTAGGWTIDGGTVTFTDAGFACQQGGFGGATQGTLCTNSTTAGGFNANGSHLSWGIDLDASGTGQLTASEITLRDGTGTSVLDTLSGVFATVTLDGSGNLTGTNGEFRRASGNSASCPDHVRYDTTAGKLSCGSITSGNLEITGSVVPAPAAAWLIAPAVLAAARFARRRKTA